MTRPLVTFGVPAYNAGPHLAAAVRSCLAQSVPVEVIVVDDGGTDGSVEAAADVLADPRVRLVRRANAGKASAVNLMMGLARADLFALNDADDVSAPTRAARQAAEFEGRPALAGVFCGHELILRGRRAAAAGEAKDESRCAADVAAFKMPGHDPTLMVRLSGLGGLRYDESVGVCQGLDFVLRLGERLPLRRAGGVDYGYRVTPGSITRTKAERRMRAQHTVLRAACARRGLDPDARFPEGRAVPPRLRNRHRENGIHTLFIDSVRAHKRSGRTLAALRDGLRCSALHPLDPEYHKALAYALVPDALAERARPAGARARAGGAP